MTESKRINRTGIVVFDEELYILPWQFPFFLKTLIITTDFQINVNRVWEQTIFVQDASIYPTDGIALFATIYHECKGMCAPIHIYFFITMAMDNNAHLSINVLLRYIAKQLN